MAHVQGTVTVNFEIVSQALHNSFSASFTKACYNTLDWAITIFLLVRQQLERIGQVFTQTLRSRMRFENLCLLKTFSSLQDQQPFRLPPVILLSTNCAPQLCGVSPRDPPNIVFQRETVAIRAQVRQCDSSLSSNWAR